jgi:hypothetical protein
VTEAAPDADRCVVMIWLEFIAAPLAGSRSVALE